MLIYLTIDQLIRVEDDWAGGTFEQRFSVRHLEEFGTYQSLVWVTTYVVVFAL
jgi:hypothetical protein